MQPLHIDWEEILTHTRARVREVGLAEIDAQVTMDFRTSQSPSSDFQNYLSSVINAIGERSYSGYRRTLDAFYESVKTENGSRIEGIEIQVNDQDYGVYGTSTIRLDDQVDLSLLVTELKRLLRDLEQAGVFDENSRD